MISVCACLFTGVAQFELLVNSLSNLASRVLIAWQWDEAWLLLLPGTTCSVEDKGEDWWQQRGGSWSRGSSLHSLWPAEAFTACPWRALRLRCLRSSKSYSLVLLLNQKMASQEKELFWLHRGLARVHVLLLTFPFLPHPVQQCASLFPKGFPPVSGEHLYRQVWNNIQLRVQPSHSWNAVPNNQHSKLKDCHDN